MQRSTIRTGQHWYGPAMNASFVPLRWNYLPDGQSYARFLCALARRKYHSVLVRKLLRAIWIIYLTRDHVGESGRIEGETLMSHPATGMAPSALTPFSSPRNREVNAG